jgi:PAS domain S-box-containing protein
MTKYRSLPSRRDKESIKVLEAFAGPLVWLDEEAKIQHVSPQFLKSFGANQSNIEGKSWITIEKGNSETDFYQLWDKLCQDRELDWTSIIMLGGKTISVNVEGRMVQNDICQFACLRVTKSSKSKTGKSLRDIRSEENQTAAWSWNFENGTFVVTDSFHRIFKTDKNVIEASQTNIVQLFQPYLDNSQLEALKKDITKLRRTNTPIEANWLLDIGEEKKNIYFEANPSLKKGDLKGMKGFIRAANHVLSPSRVRTVLANVLEESNDIALILNEELKVVFLNPFSKKAIGFSHDDLDEGLSIFKLDIENSKKQWEKYLNKVKKKKNLRFITSFQRKDATVFPVEAQLTFYKDRYGALVFLSARDISEIRKSQSIISADLAQKTSLADQLEKEKSYLESEQSINTTLDNIITISKNYQPVLEQVKSVAPLDTTVLIEGETGTGKELLAQAIHQLSDRSKRTMIKLNCANFTKELIASELFGHEKGAFTGAYQQKKGRFELAHNGTLFLDEVGELPMDIQSQLLRVLQEGEFERVGGTSTIHIDVRIIAATNRDLNQMIAEGKFRQDLFYRLNVFPINNLPLRKRREDIEILTWHFLRKYSKKVNRSIKRIKPKDLDRLKRYDFPGNIRELENIIERSVILTKGDVLNLDFWQPLTSLPNDAQADTYPTLDEIQIAHIRDALEKCKWRISGEEGAARLLGLKDQTLFSKLRKFGISRNGR